MASAPSFFSKIFKQSNAVVAAFAAQQKIATTLYAGDPYLHWVTGGISLGKITVFYGPAGSGKSALSCYLAGKVQQKNGGYVIINDSEMYYHKRPDRVARLAKFGIDIEKTIIICSKELSSSFGNIFEIYEAIKSGEIKIAAYIVDSWKGFENKAAAKKIVAGKVDEAGDAHRGNAKTMNPILDQFVNIAAASDAPVFITQHVAVNQDQYGADYLLPGGENFRHQADAIIYLESVAASDARLAAGGVQIAKSDYETEKVGKRIRVKAEKTRNTVEGKKGEFWFDFDKCDFAMLEDSLFELAVRLGIISHPVVESIDKEGNKVYKEQNAYWEFPSKQENSRRFHGKESVLEALRNEKEFFVAVQSSCFPPEVEEKKEDEPEKPVKKRKEKE